MKLKKWKIITASLAALMLITAVTLTVYAYFSTQVYVYTNDGDKQKLELGMNLQLLFDKLDETAKDSEGNLLLVGKPLNIPYYELRKADGTLPNKDDPTGTTYFNYYQDPESDSYVAPIFDPTAPWGSPQNPYVISNGRHLQNLSTLQRVGYFDVTYISENYTASGSGDSLTYTYNGGISMPYFLVCNAHTGGPIVIDGTDIGTVRPIGSAEHPFIGVIGGAFTSGSATVGTGTNAKTVSVSSFHNIKVQTDTDQLDIGLFGYVGYLGNEPTAEDTEPLLDADGNPVLGSDDKPVMVQKTTFVGASSVIQNLILSDVTIIVDEPSIWEVISKYIGHVFSDHNFSDSNFPSDTVVPHENHHIGIFAGHVSYASIEYISVYYSSDDVCAIDLLHTNDNRTGGTGDEPNYYSTTGIVGFMHKMNSPVKNQATTTTNAETGVVSITAISGNCLVNVGGTSTGGVTLTPGGSGLGGGTLIGVGRGYVMAKTLYNGFHYISDNQSMYDRVWSVKIGSVTHYGAMFFMDENGTITSQYGNRVTINDDDGTTYEIMQNGSSRSYAKYVIRKTVVTTNDLGETTITFEYKFYDNSEGKSEGVLVNKSACTELPQTIWQYVEEIPKDANGLLINDRDEWGPYIKEAVLLVEKSSGTYTLTDGVTNVNITAKTGGGYTATIPAAVDANGNAATIANVFFLRQDGTYSLTPSGTVKTPAVFYEKPLKLQPAKTMFGEELCTQDATGVTLLDENGYYFYDGVFTFALSSENDTIEATWENETPDNLVIGPNDNSKWQANTTKGNSIVVAYIKPITDIAGLNAAITNNQKIFIGYHNNYTTQVLDSNNVDISWVGNNLYLMNLSTTSTSLGSIFSDDFFTTSSYPATFVTAEDRESLINGMINGEAGAFPSDDDAKNQALLTGLQNGSIQILNLSSSKDMDTLKKQYQIVPAVSGSGYSFKGDISGYYLSLLWRKGNLTGNNSYSIWAGANKPDNSALYNYNWTTTASVVDNGESFRISYTINNTPKHVTYNNQKFQGSNSPTDVYLYTVIDMDTADFGSITFEPTEGGQTLSADQCILWPNAVMTQDGTMFAGETFSDPYTLNGGYTTGDFKTDGNGYDTYRVVSLADLIVGDDGWQNGLGQQITNQDLRKKFTMQEAIDFSISLKLPNRPNISLDDSSVMAPVGPNGAYANIPQGSIAFRINKSGESKIRVIVSVPVSPYYKGYDAGDADARLKLQDDVDYYLGLWKTEDLVEGEIKLNTFNMGSAEQKFELPRSRPYKPGTAAGDAEYIIVNDKNGNEYRCYLNGDRILVGYEFVVQEAGTYILGTTAGRWSLGGLLFGGNIDNDYPMEIVYASADGTASPGNDGTSTSVYGSIDYVYSYNNKIIHVQDYDTTSSTVDYNRYYSSNCITYTKNDTLESDSTTKYLNVQDFKARIWRTIETDNNGTPDDTSDDTSKIVLHVNVRTQDEAAEALFYCQTAGYDPDEIRITVGEPSTS